MDTNCKQLETKQRRKRNLGDEPCLLHALDEIRARALMGVDHGSPDAAKQSSSAIDLGQTRFQREKTMTLSGETRCPVAEAGTDPHQAKVKQRQLLQTLRFLPRSMELAIFFFFSQSKLAILELLFGAVLWGQTDPVP